MIIGRGKKPKNKPNDDFYADAIAPFSFSLSPRKKYASYMRPRPEFWLSEEVKTEKENKPNDDFYDEDSMPLRHFPSSLFLWVDS